jgi:hypothetical protein
MTVRWTSCLIDRSPGLAEPRRCLRESEDSSDPNGLKGGALRWPDVCF